MKNLSALLLITLALGFLGLACKNPLNAYTNQYKCELPGMPQPTTAEEYIDRAYKHAEDNNYKSDPAGCALGACSEAVRLDPKNPNAYYCRASGYRSTGQLDKAVADLDEAIKLKADFAMAYATRGAVQGELKQFDKGIADLTKAIELLGSDVAYYHYGNRGELYFQSEKYDEAVKDFTKAIEMRPEHEYNYADRARAYEKLGKMDLAEADRRKAAELGSIESEPPTDDKTTPKTASDPNAPTVSGGVLDSKVISMPTPPLPPAARAVRASGKVIVAVTVDENGNVVDAKARTGHPLLKAAAEQTARGAKFNPTVAGGKKVKVTGILTIEFPAP